MHMSSRNLSDQRKITSHRETARISWIIQVSLTESKNVTKVWFKEKKPLKTKLYGPFLWIRFNCLKATATSRRQFTFYHSVPRNSWYSFYRPQKDERLSRPWSHSLVLNTGPLDWESSALTTRPLLHRLTINKIRMALNICKAQL